MSRFWILCGLILGIFIVLVSCKNDQPTAPQQFHDVTVNIDGLDTIYTAPEGDLIATAFEIVVTGMDGVPVEEVPVSIWVESGPGDVASREWTTSADGTVQALYYVTVPLGDTTAIICAVVGLDTTTESVKLRGEIAPVAIELQPDPPVIETQYGQSAQTQLTATVTNPTGLPAPDVNVMFSVTGGEAQIEGSGVTDEDGHVRATLNVDGSWFGEVEITEPRRANHPLKSVMNHGRYNHCSD